MAMTSPMFFEYYHNNSTHEVTVEKGNQGLNQVELLETKV